MKQLLVFILICIELQSARSQNLPSFEGRIGQIAVQDVNTSTLRTSDPICYTGKISECFRCTVRAFCLPDGHISISSCPIEAPHCVETLEGAECSPNPDSERCPYPFDNDIACVSEGFFPSKKILLSKT